jgi:hypothetical protein
MWQLMYLGTGIFPIASHALNRHYDCCLEAGQNRAMWASSSINLNSTENMYTDQVKSDSDLFP